MIVSEDRDVDVAVVGGGPAGSAAAIWCAMRGLVVVLIEGQPFPRPRPGETLHPGVSPILRQLGVDREVDQAGFLRHPGQTVKWEGEPRFVAFGGDSAGPWLGFQAVRETFDTILLRRAAALGAEVLQPCRALRPLVVGDRVVGVDTSNGVIRSRFAIDASGGGHWLGRRLHRGVSYESPPLTVYYGYATAATPMDLAFPRLEADPAGWTWVAHLGDHSYAWARLPFSRQKRPPPGPPPLLVEVVARGPTRGADVTWRLVPESAGPGYFLAGDAAAVLDPLSSHGVLKALMSGIQAAHLVDLVIGQGVDESRAIQSYREWLLRFFEHDVRVLRESYGRLPVEWRPPLLPALEPRPFPVAKRGGQPEER